MSKGSLNTHPLLVVSFWHSPLVCMVYLGILDPRIARYIRMFIDLSFRGNAIYLHTVCVYLYV